MKMVSINFLVFDVIILFLILNFVYCAEYVTVETDVGTLRGVLKKTETGGPRYCFEGIPYAEPPIGGLRFQPPVSKSSWSGVLNVTAKGSKCPQQSDGETVGSEDCLFLNVYTPEMPSSGSSLKPVFVWIHGGCFTGGSGGGKPDYFVDNDIVYVSINYRLGLLGFLSTGDQIVPGNMGLKDQVEALRWVQRNIAAFGGDPNEVTIGGQSAGGAAVSYLVLSPLTAGLFKRAIAHSGAAINPWAFSRNATDRALRFAEYLGYTAQNSEDLYNYYMTVGIDDLVRDKAKALSPEDRKSLFKCTWVPSAEPNHEGAFLTEEPWVLIAEGRYNYVPYLTGHTDLEMLSKTQPGGTLATEDKISDLNEDFEIYVGCDLRLPTRDEQLEAASKVREFYYGDSEITLQSNYTTAVMVSDLEFIEGVHRVLDSMLQYTSLPVYYYQFTYVGYLSDYPDGPGAAHSDDTTYMFANSDLDESEPEGAILRNQMTEMWANFVRNSIPTPEITSSLTVNWTQYTTDNTAYLGIDRPLSTGTGLNQQRMNFWRDLLP